MKVLYNDHQNEETISHLFLGMGNFGECQSHPLHIVEVTFHLVLNILDFDESYCHRLHYVKMLHFEINLSYPRHNDVISRVQETLYIL